MPKYQIIKSEYSPYTNKEILTISMKATCEVSDLPTDVSPDSLAYKLVSGTMTVYGFSADGEWVEVTI